MLQELNKFSPLRVIDPERGSVLEPGQLGVVMAPAGAGKTACLVQIGIDHLIHGRRVAHVTLDQPVDRVRDWYDEGLKDLAGVWGPLDFTIESRLDMERRRHIFSYQSFRFTAAHFGQQLDLVATHQDFVPCVVIIDGYELAAASKSDIAELKAMAGERKAAIWLAVRTEASAAEAIAKGALPPPGDAVADLIDEALYVSVEGDDARLRVVKSGRAKVGTTAPVDLRTMLLRA